MAQLIQMPRRAVAEPPPVTAVTVDDWGRDARVIELLAPMFRLRWRTTVAGVDAVPAHTGALLVTNARRLSFSPLYVALALSGATGRPVRFAGRPDDAPRGAALRRLGALLGDAAEVHGALRHGELVVVGAQATSHPRHAGSVDHQMIAAAMTAGVAVIPVASMSSPFGRSAQVVVGSPIERRRIRRGPLGDVEIAETTQRRLQTMLDQLDAAQPGAARIDRSGER